MAGSPDFPGPCWARPMARSSPVFATTYVAPTSAGYCHPGKTRGLHTRSRAVGRTFGPADGVLMPPSTGLGSPRAVLANPKNLGGVCPCRYVEAERRFQGRSTGQLGRAAPTRISAFSGRFLCHRFGGLGDAGLNGPLQRKRRAPARISTTRGTSGLGAGMAMAGPRIRSGNTATSRTPTTQGAGVAVGGLP